MRRVLILVAFLAACTSATGGHGSTVPSVGSTPTGVASTPPSSPPSSSLSSSSLPSPLTSSPSLPASPSAPVVSSASTRPAPGRLSCPPGSITATGAPFCYPLPNRFTDFSSRTDYGSGWTYRTLIGLGGPDLVEVLGSLGAQDFDRLSDAQLRAYFNRAGLVTKGKFGFASAGAVQVTTLDGARAFAQDGRYTNGVLAHLVRAFAGRTIVFVSCQSRLQATRVDAACAQILLQLKIAQT